MSFKSFLYRRILIGFFVAATCIGAFMAIIGIIFEPYARFGYEGLFFPLVYGAMTMLPVLIGYSKREISVREALVRNLIQFVLIEIIVLAILYLNGALTGASLTISVAVSVLIIYLTVSLVLWINDNKTAKAVNEALLKMQKKYEVL